MVKTVKFSVCFTQETYKVDLIVKKKLGKNKTLGVFRNWKINEVGYMGPGTDEVTERINRLTQLLGRK